MTEIIGIGDADVDIMIKVPHIPGHDEKVRGIEIGKCAGGIIANFCSAAATFGIQTSAVCSVGDDAYGVVTTEDLRSRGVDVSHMVVKKGESTYYSIVYLDDTGEKALTVVATNALIPQKEDIDTQFIREAKRIHMTSLDMELVDYVARCLDGTDVRLSLDIEPTCSATTVELWKRVMPRVDIIFPNEAGLKAVTGISDMTKAAETFLAWGAKTVVVTCGENGAHIFQKGYHYHQNIFKVNVVDTTGAGDCFNAAFLGCVIRGLSMEKAIEYAAAAAAISITAVGARTAQPTEAQVENFIDNRKNER